MLCWPLQGMCYNGVCQPGNKLFEVKSVSPMGTIPANNTEFIFLRLFNAGTASAGVVALTDESGRSSPAAVTSAIVDQAPADPRDATGASKLTTAFAMMNTGSTDRVEAALFYRNNTPDHPPGLFNGMNVSVGLMTALLPAVTPTGSSAASATRVVTFVKGP